jgi:hypothetical protein
VRLAVAALLVDPGSRTRSHALGTDGSQLVWLETAKASSDEQAERRSEHTIWTGRFTTDPAMLAPRTLGTFFSDDAAPAAWVVGCGRAAIGARRGEILVVDLADGARRELRSPCTDRSPCLSTPWAVDCHELFVRSDGPHMTVSRVRLEALPRVAP